MADEIRIIEMVCPSCGADLKLNAEDSHAVCEYCGAKVFITGVRRDPEQEGYEFEKGRQRARDEAASAAVPRKRITWLWVLGWIFIFPVPLTIIVVRSNMKQWQKAAVIIVAWAAYFGLAYLGRESNNKKEPAPSAPVSSSAVAP
ncbi:MAG: hypothetical protein J5756_06675 [Clostridia bacterium]|nr:hypothetical protein [Clostridia bacterium]